MIRLDRLRLFLPVLDVLLIAASYAGAFALRYEFRIPAEQLELMGRFLPVLITLRLTALVVFRLYKGLWIFAGITDLLNTAKAVAASSAVFIPAVYLLGGGNHPRSVFAIDSLTVLLLLGAVRFSSRLVQQLTAAGTGRRVLIYGAGGAGEMIAREMLASGYLHYRPVGFVDDDPAKGGRTIHGLMVHGGREALPKIVRKTEAHEIVVAVPSAGADEVRRILNACRNTGLPVRIVPGRLEIIEGEAHLSQIREVRLTDLLGREEVVLDIDETADYLAGRSIMVTGAGGSIGLELCRQVLRYRPGRLVLVERSEFNLYNLMLELAGRERREGFVPIVADVNDRAKIARALAEHKPEVIFHAAAHKHVPLLEENPEEAVVNNFCGTVSMAELAVRAGVRKFILVSTDKAVNPVSYMGASKKLAELFVQTAGSGDGTRFITVRFGNVLGSAGSVVPLFERQIARGGPVTVTDPDVRRYFMTVQEAAQLILQAGAMGNGGEIYILDMGEPIRVVDLARELISLSGFDPEENIAIRYTGLRPGEKLTEELWSRGEQPRPTHHPKILIAQSPGCDRAELEPAFREIERLAREMKRDELLESIRRVIPGFKVGPPGPKTGEQETRGAGDRTPSRPPG